MFKRTDVAPTQFPVLWVPIEEISSVRVLEPKPEGYVAPSVEIQTVSHEAAADTLKVGIKTADAETEAPPVAEKATPAVTKQDKVESTQDSANVATK
jgi:hypothetical protein